MKGRGLERSTLSRPARLLSPTWAEASLSCHTWSLRMTLPAACIDGSAGASMPNARRSSVASGLVSSNRTSTPSSWSGLLMPPAAVILVCPASIRASMA